MVTHAIFPSFPRLVDQRLVEVLGVSREFIISNGSAVVPQFFIIECITKPGYNGSTLVLSFEFTASWILTSMSQEHSQTNAFISLHQGPILLEHSEIIEFRTDAVDLVSVIQRQLSLLD